MLSVSSQTPTPHSIPGARRFFSGSAFSRPARGIHFQLHASGCMLPIRVWIMGDAAGEIAVPAHRRALVGRERSVDDGGDGPHDPGMEQRVARLETDVGDIKATLGRLEPMLIRMASEFGEFRKDIAKLDGRVSNLEDRMSGVENRMSGLEGRMSGLEDRVAQLDNRVWHLDGRVSQLPNTWQLMTGVVAIIGVVFAMIRFGMPH